MIKDVESTHNCRNAGDGDKAYWDAQIEAAKAEALKYGKVINFPS